MIKNRFISATFALTTTSLFACALDSADLGEAELAVGARPSFQAPFPCGVKIRMESFGHAPALDIFRNPTGETEGAQLVAPADGVVNLSYMSDPSGAGNIIQINHGGGWFTTYIHLQSRQVTVGEHVEQGEPIGRVGHTGQTSNGVPHVHFEMAIDKDNDGQADWGHPNDERVPPVFNGVTYGQYNGQTSYLTSNNCGGASARPLSDVNGDGRDDIVGISPTAMGQTSIVTWLSNGTTVGGGNPGTSGAPYAGLRTTLGDVNGDGVVDLIGALPRAEGGTSFILSLGQAGLPGFAGFMPAGITAGNPARIHAGDVNGDGRDDIIGIAPTAAGQTSIVTWLSNGTTMGGGNPGTSGAVFADLRTAVGDVNGDGVIDLIGALPRVEGGTSFIVSLGIRGSAGFAGFMPAGNTAGVAAPIQAGDVNGDGLDDIVGIAPTAQGTTSIVTWLSNGTTVGGGNPGTSSAVYAGLRTTLGDVNGDGVIDLIAALPRAEGGTSFMVAFGRAGASVFDGLQPAGTTAGNPSYLVSR